MIGCIGLLVAKIPFRKIFIVFTVIFTFSLLNSVMILFITPTHGSELTGSYTSFVYIDMQQLHTKHYFMQLHFR